VPAFFANLGSPFLLKRRALLGSSHRLAGVGFHYPSLYSAFGRRELYKCRTTDSDHSISQCSVTSVTSAGADILRHQIREIVTTMAQNIIFEQFKTVDKMVDLIDVGAFKFSGEPFFFVC
jgi:hypothetical protein